MKPQIVLGWAIAASGAVLLAGAGVVWLFDPVIGFLDSVYGLIAFLLLLCGIALFLGGLWILSVPSSAS